MKIGVFWEAIKNGETQVFYVDAQDYDAYIARKKFDSITKIKIEFVVDDCFEILKMQHPSTIVSTIYKILSEWYLHNN